MNITGYLFDSAASAPGESALYTLVANAIKYALAGKSDQFLYNWDTYMEHAPEAAQYYAGAGKTLIDELRTKHGLKIKDADMDAVTPEYAFTMAALGRFVSVGIDMDKEGYPPALFTRSANLLSFLVNQGMASQEDVDKVSKDLFGNKTAKAVAEGKYVAARLDFEELKDGRPRFKLVIPRSSMEIGSGKQFAIIPVPFYYIFERILEQLARDRAFRFTKQSVDGSHTHFAAVSSQIVRDAYTDSDRELVEARIKKIKTGYDVLRLRYLAFDLESSIHSVGVTSFRPEMLDVLTPVSVADADRSRHEINFTLLRGIYKTRINQGKGADLDTLGITDLSGYATVTDKREALHKHAEEWSDANLYTAMKAKPEFFGDIDAALATRSRMQPKFLKGFQMIDLASLGSGVPLTEKDTLSARAKALTMLLDKGVVKITAAKKNGNLIEMIGSNNPEVLQRMLGKDYVVKFENPRTKLYYLQELLKSGSLAVGSDLNRAIVKCNVQDLLAADKMNPPGKVADSTRKKLALEAIQDAITVLKEKAATRKPAPDHVVVRDVYATDAADYMRTVSVGNLVSIEVSPLEEIDAAVAKYAAE